MTTLLEVQNLSVWLPVEGSTRPILTGVSLTIDEGQALGVVGESGSGKSMTARAIARLLPPAAEIAGTVMFDGTDPYALKGRRCDGSAHRCRSSSKIRARTSTRSGASATSCARERSLAAAKARPPH